MIGRMADRDETFIILRVDREEPLILLTEGRNLTLGLNRHTDVELQARMKIHERPPTRDSQDALADLEWNLHVSRGEDKIGEGDE